MCHDRIIYFEQALDGSKQLVMKSNFSIDLRDYVGNLKSTTNLDDKQQVQTNRIKTDNKPRWTSLKCYGCFNEIEIFMSLWHVRLNPAWKH